VLPHRKLDETDDRDTANWKTYVAKGAFGCRACLSHFTYTENVSVVPSFNSNETGHEYLLYEDSDVWVSVLHW